MDPGEAPGMKIPRRYRGGAGLMLPPGDRSDTVDRLAGRSIPRSLEHVRTVIFPSYCWQLYANC
ncbi:MAG: hypothetical protein J7453_11840, partial [Thermomicrobium sp.]|nr:hypothetical protein [Thermomicrobium sp.]